MWIDLINVLIAVATLAVTVVIYQLGRRVGLRGTMQQRAETARELSKFSQRIYVEGLNSNLLLMNAQRYARGDYTAYQTNQVMGLSWRGDLFIGAEFVGLRHDGFEVITGAGVAGRPDALLVLFIPFDRVHWVNLDGDENFNQVIVYTSFVGPYPSPHSYSYAAERQPFKMREGGRDYYRQISGSGVHRTTGIRAVWAAAPRWIRAIRLSLWDRRAARRMHR